MIKKSILYILFLLTIFAIIGCSNFKGDMDWELSEFHMKDQNNKDFQLKDIKGDIWLVDFIFTSCATFCPQMTANMAQIQEMVKEENLKVNFASFSVDPEVDSPEILNSYVQKFTENTDNWYLLSGYSQDYIKDFALKNFKTIANKPENGQGIHSNQFYLINKKGVVVKSYDGNNNVPFDNIVKDIKALSRQ
ncbi:SCO family protein [Heyndrickxia oleronia]|uniref:SCO family protein n=1 Tax=Heyndrickxia oleronia TaxID=38875 RepID=UPI001BB38056|nr:SCO family protein [Heyndrickxia oleronia]